QLECVEWILVHEYLAPDIDAGRSDTAPVRLAQCIERRGRRTQQPIEIRRLPHELPDPVHQGLMFLQADDLRMPFEHHLEQSGARARKAEYEDVSTRRIAHARR